MHITSSSYDAPFTARHLPLRSKPYPQPQPIIIDTNLRTKPTCKLFKNYQAGVGAQPWIIGGRKRSWGGIRSPTEALRDDRRTALEAAGGVVIEVAMLNGKGTSQLSPPPQNRSITVSAQWIYTKPSPLSQKREFAPLWWKAGQALSQHS